MRHKMPGDVVIRGVQPMEEVAIGMADTAGRFDTIFQEHYPRIVAMLARLMGDRAHAEEIAADVFCKLSRRSPLFGGDLTAWIYRVATNAGLDAIRSNSRRKKRENEAGIESLRTAPNVGALEDMLRAERCARVREILGALKPRDTQLLLLRAEGLSYRELAQSLGIQPGSVGTLLARAEAEFERKFRARYGDSL